MIEDKERKQIEYLLKSAQGFVPGIDVSIGNKLIERLCRIALASEGLVEALRFLSNEPINDEHAIIALAKFNKAVSGE